MASNPWGKPATPTSKNPWGTSNAKPWAPAPGNQAAMKWTAAASGLSPEDLTFYNTAKNRADFQYLQALEQNRHNRSGARIGFTNQSRDVKEQFRQQREGFLGGLAARGVASGPYGVQQVSHFENERNRALGALKQQYLQQLSGLTMADLQLINQRNATINDVSNAQAARQAAASVIRDNGGY